MAKKTLSLPDDIAIYYERLICGAFRCTIKDYSFVSKAFCTAASKHHDKTLASFLQCALIILNQRNTAYSDELKEYINKLDNDLTYRRAKLILMDMKKRNIPSLM